MEAVEIGSSYDDDEQKIWNNYRIDLQEVEHFNFYSWSFWWSNCSEWVFHGFQLWKFRWLTRVDLSFQTSMLFGLLSVDYICYSMGWVERRQSPWGVCLPLYNCGWFVSYQTESVTTLHLPCFNTTFWAFLFVMDFRNSKP